MVHLSDLDWPKPGDEVIKDYKKGDNVKAVVLDVDSEKERISLGIKQLAGDPIDALAQDSRRATPVTCTVVAVQENGIEVEDRRQRSSPPSSSAPTCRATAPSSGRSASTSATRSMRRSTSVDKAARRITVSIKALEIAEEKQAVAQYGSTDSGASLGDIFKAAIKKRETADGEPEEADKDDKE